MNQLLQKIILLSCFVMCIILWCRFAAESTTLGKEEKRVKQLLTVPIDDNGKEDLYSHLFDVIHFIGKINYEIESCQNLFGM